MSISQSINRWTPVVGVAVALALLAVATSQYSGDVHWTRVTVSLLCAPVLPDGTPNLGRALPIFALLLMCVSMSWLFELISRTAQTPLLRKTIQIAGIGSMVYALLTATPMHNLMVHIALAFFLAAVAAIVVAVYRSEHYALAYIGIGCIAVKLSTASLYYTNNYSDYWGVLQKLTFILTTVWLFAVHLMPSRKALPDESMECT